MDLRNAASGRTIGAGGLFAHGVPHFPTAVSYTYFVLLNITMLVDLIENGYTYAAE
jgi:hypothetical protein